MVATTSFWITSPNGKREIRSIKKYPLSLSGESLPEIALCCFVEIEHRLEGFRVAVRDEEVEDEIRQKYELNDDVPDVLGRE